MGDIVAIDHCWRRMLAQDKGNRVDLSRETCENN